MKIAFQASDAADAQDALEQLQKLYESVSPQYADVVVVLGGDGRMLQALHEFMNTGKPLYGLNRGTIGFLMNEYASDGLLDRISKAVATTLHPLVMEVTNSDGTVERAFALRSFSAAAILSGGKISHFD